MSNSSREQIVEINSFSSKYISQNPQQSYNSQQQNNSYSNSSQFQGYNNQDYDNYNDDPLLSGIIDSSLFSLR
jgi:hypothetical protein